jgi:hypothetical protein
MPPARCQCCDETGYRRLRHRGLAPKGVMPSASRKSHRRQELEFSIPCLPRARRPVTDMSASVEVRTPFGEPTTNFQSRHACRTHGAHSILRLPELVSAVSATLLITISPLRRSCRGNTNDLCLSLMAERFDGFLTIRIPRYHESHEHSIRRRITLRPAAFELNAGCRTGVDLLRPCCPKIASGDGIITLSRFHRHPPCSRLPWNCMGLIGGSNRTQIDAIAPWHSKHLGSLSPRRVSIGHDGAALSSSTDRTRRACPKGSTLKDEPDLACQSIRTAGRPTEEER